MTQTGTARGGGGVCRREVGKTKSNRSWASGYLTQKCRVGNAREGTKKKSRREGVVEEDKGAVS